MSKLNEMADADFKWAEARAAGRVQILADAYRSALDADDTPMDVSQLREGKVEAMAIQIYINAVNKMEYMRSPAGLENTAMDAIKTANTFFDVLEADS